MRFPELGLNKFQERPYGASTMQENLLAAGAPPRSPLGELTALSRTPDPVERRAGQEHHPRLCPLDLELLAPPLTRNRMLMMTGWIRL